MIFVFLRPHVSALCSHYTTRPIIYFPLKMFVLESYFPGMFTRHPYFPLALHVRCRAQPCRKKYWTHSSYMLHHLYCCLSRWASIATCRSLAANKDFGDHICLMVDGFCAHTGSRRAPSVRASARSARGKFSPQMFVWSDPDFPAVFAADSKFSSFVRKIYYSVELYYKGKQFLGCA